MKELFAAFNTDFFRALTTIIIPGAIAASPWTVQMILIFVPLRSLVSQNHVETAFIMFLAVVLVGLIIEDIGARIESWLDSYADKKTGAKHTEECTPPPDGMGVGIEKVCVVGSKPMIRFGVRPVSTYQTMPSGLTVIAYGAL